MQKQSQATFVMRIAESSQSQSSALSQGNNTVSPPIDRTADYCTGQNVSRQGLSSMRIGPGSFRSNGACYRRAA